ncbi:DUF4421 domain-containing protein [Negadavirga shengliensis]|uniref:DUF4421 domain-containing protein n=1 Tax=Negadavirga shengliensis TaxID=1389218 RepID=A0ABV9T0P0_9BACT
MARAQGNLDSTVYYQEFPDQLTGRYYFSRKYTGMRFQDKSSGLNLLFMPNSTLNMGVGATYSNLTLNLAYGFGFLNPDRGRGETNYLDLQAHVYPKKWVIDFFGQFYRGYYIHQGKPEDLDMAGTYLNPDMRVRKIGTSVQYLFNHEKFSYRAAFLQNEWQKKSAGSLLAGFEIYGGEGKDEEGGFIPSSSLVEGQANVESVRFFEFGPNLGYAYTLVIMKHFFITVSASSNLSVGFSEVRDDSQNTRTQWGVSPNYFLRGFAGYNSDRWSVNANYVYNQVNFPDASGYRTSMMTGNYRLNFVYRFTPGSGLKKYLRPIDNIKNKLGLR